MRPSPTKPAEPSQSPPSRVTPFRHPRLGLGYLTPTLVQRLPVRQRGVLGLKVSVTSDRHGQQHKLTRRLIYTMLQLY